MTEVTRSFCWCQYFVPWGCTPPAPGPYTFIKSWKNCIKSDFRVFFLKLATNKWSDKTFLLTSRLCPLGGLSAPAPVLYACIKSWKKLYKMRLPRDFFKTCNKWPKWQDVAVDIIFHPQGVIPCPGTIYMYKIMKKMCKIRLQTDFVFKLVANDHSDKRFLLTSKFSPLRVAAPDL